MSSGESISPPSTGSAGCANSSANPSAAGGRGRRIRCVDPVGLMGGAYPPVYRNGRHHREGDEYYFECPCGSDRLGMNGDPASPKYGVYSCFACGRVKGHARRLGPEAERQFASRSKPREDPTDWETAARIYTWIWRNSTLTDSHAEYLRGRGLDPSLLRARTIGPGVKEITARFTRDELLAAGLFREHERRGFSPRLVLGRGRLLVPYFSEDRKSVEYLRSYGPDRRDDYRKMIGPKGIPSGRFLYGSWLVPEDCKSLLVTEGEFKAACALAHGYACVGLPGVNSGHGALLAFCKGRGIGHVWLCFDSEVHPELKPGHREPADAAVDKLADRFRSEKVGILRVRLPLAPFGRSGKDCGGEGGDPRRKTDLDDRGARRKTDLDDYVLRCGPAAFEQVLGEAMRLSPR